MRVTTVPKKRLTKHELKEDRFVTTALEAWDYMVLHRSTVLFVALGIVGVLGVAILYQRSAGARTTRANEILLLAMNDFDAGNFDAAANGLTQFLDRAPRHPKSGVAGVALGNALLALGRTAEAEKPFAAAAKDAPGGSDAWVAATVGLGLVAESQGRADEAFRLFDEAARTATSQELAAEAAAHAIRAKIQMNDLDGANAMLEKARKDYAETRGARRFAQLEGELVAARSR